MDLQLQMEPNVMVVRTFNSSTQEVEAEASRPLCVGGQPDLIYTVSCRPAIMAASGRHGGKNRRSCLQTQAWSREDKLETDQGFNLKALTW